MTDGQEKTFASELKKELDKSKLEGFTLGSKIVSKLIYNKVVNVDRNYSKNDLLRVIKDIKLACSKGLTDKNKSESEVK